jgi:hypothetical protein
MVLQLRDLLELELAEFLERVRRYPFGVLRISSIALYRLAYVIEDAVDARLERLLAFFDRSDTPLEAVQAPTDVVEKLLEPGLIAFG